MHTDNEFEKYVIQCC